MANSAGRKLLKLFCDCHPVSTDEFWELWRGKCGPEVHLKKCGTQIITLRHRQIFISKIFNIITSTSADAATYTKAAVSTLSAFSAGSKQMTPAAAVNSDINLNQKEIWNVAIKWLALQSCTYQISIRKPINENRRDRLRLLVASFYPFDQTTEQLFKTGLYHFLIHQQSQPHSKLQAS